MESKNKKMGRPTDNPLTEDVKFRLDKKTLAKLDNYSRVNSVTRAESIRHAINLLLK